MDIQLTVNGFRNNTYIHYFQKKTDPGSLLKVAQQPQQGRLSIGLAPRLPRVISPPGSTSTGGASQWRRLGPALFHDVAKVAGRFQLIKDSLADFGDSQRCQRKRNKTRQTKQTKHNNKQTNKQTNKPTKQPTNTRLDMVFGLWSFRMPWAGVSAKGHQIYRFPNKCIEMIRICSRPWPLMFILTEPKKFRKWILKIPSLETNIAPQNGWLED